MSDNITRKERCKIIKDELIKQLDHLEMMWPQGRSANLLLKIDEMLKLLESLTSTCKALPNFNKDDFSAINRVRDAFKGLFNQNTHWPSDLDEFIESALKPKRVFSMFSKKENNFRKNQAKNVGSVGAVNQDSIGTDSDWSDSETDDVTGSSALQNSFDP